VGLSGRPTQDRSATRTCSDRRAAAGHRTAAYLTGAEITLARGTSGLWDHRGNRAVLRRLRVHPLYNDIHYADNSETVSSLPTGTNSFMCVAYNVPDLTLTKTEGTYNAATNTIAYTYTVKASGIPPTSH